MLHSAMMHLDVKSVASRLVGIRTPGHLELSLADMGRCKLNTEKTRTVPHGDWTQDFQLKT